MEQGRGLGSGIRGGGEGFYNFTVSSPGVRQNSKTVSGRFHLKKEFAGCS